MPSVLVACLFCRYSVGRDIKSPFYKPAVLCSISEMTALTGENILAVIGSTYVWYQRELFENNGQLRQPTGLISELSSLTNMTIEMYILL